MEVDTFRTRNGGENVSAGSKPKHFDIWKVAKCMFYINLKEKKKFIV